MYVYDIQKIFHGNLRPEMGHYYIKVSGIPKHLRVFVESLRHSSEIFGNSRKMFGNVRLAFGTILENLRKEAGKKSEVFGKSSKTPSSVCLHKKRTLHVSSKI